MKSNLLVTVSALLAASIVIVGCGQSSLAPTPTTKAAEPTNAAATAKVAEPTKAPAQTPTKAVEPTKAVGYPDKSKYATMIIPWPGTGGASDVAARMMASGLEKELGIPFQPVNKPGAASQLGLTELAKAKPDGYTIGLTVLPPGINVYLDPERQATFDRKDFQPIANFVVDPLMISVKADSPYKTLDDLVKTAKANPEKVKIGDAGILTTPHMITLELQRQTGAKFAIVHFDSDPAALAALLGGHVDAIGTSPAPILAPSKSGQIRVLGVSDKMESPFFPGIKPFIDQGFNINLIASRGIAAPAGTPKEIVDILSKAAKKAMEADEFKKKANDMAMGLRYMDPAEYEAHWADLEKVCKPLVELSKAEAIKK